MSVNMVVVVVVDGRKTRFEYEFQLLPGGVISSYCSVRLRSVSPTSNPSDTSDMIQLIQLVVRLGWYST